PSMENAYDAALRVDLKRAAERAGVELSEGVYLALLGPNYETAAEMRAFARLGADAVGMSTVPEVIVARHCGLRVAGLSIISNLGAGLGGEEIGHDRVLQIVAKAAEQVARLLDAFLTELVGRR
ncbi:MAG: purine-nucleoside phosphorylase, partial [Alphaproteobacteria bacterium]|nr:purine-nucleoside phosphorylase [Alphaproteobacteria bacterium]